MPDNPRCLKMRPIVTFRFSLPHKICSHPYGDAKNHNSRILETEQRGGQLASSPPDVWPSPKSHSHYFEGQADQRCLCRNDRALISSQLLGYSDDGEGSDRLPSIL